MKRILEHANPPKLGYGLAIKRGQHLRVIDLEGKQVIDMALFNEANPRERLMEGDTLMSTLCRPMMTFVQETPAPKGVHDTHNRMCNRYLYESYGFGPRDGCHENISKAVASWGPFPEGIPDTMDLSMNYQHDCAQRLPLHPGEDRGLRDGLRMS